MSSFTRVRTGSARGALRSAQRSGIQVRFKHREADDWTTVYATPVQQGLGSFSDRYRMKERGAMVLRIPIGQTGVTAMTNGQRSITPGDRFEYPSGSSRFFYVPEGDEAVQMTPHGSEYIVLLVEHKTKNSGLNG